MKQCQRMTSLMRRSRRDRPGSRIAANVFRENPDNWSATERDTTRASEPDVVTRHIADRHARESPRSGLYRRHVYVEWRKIFGNLLPNRNDCVVFSCIEVCIAVKIVWFNDRIVVDVPRILLIAIKI